MGAATASGADGCSAAARLRRTLKVHVNNGFAILRLLIAGVVVQREGVSFVRVPALSKSGQV